MKKEKLFSNFVCLIIVCSMILSTHSVTVNAADIYTAAPSEEEISSLADFDAVDELIEQRVNALTENDMNKYRKISEELKEHGCEDISAKEVQQLTGNTPNDLLNPQSLYQNRTFNSGISLYSAASTNVTFSKVMKKVKYKGKTYKVMKITASPTGAGTLFKTGSVAKRYNRPIAAGTLNVLKIIVKKVGTESKLVKALSLFDTVNSAIKGFEKTTKVQGVEANYTWAVDEICSFIYVYDKRVKNYAIGASYNKAHYVVTVNIPYLKIKNGKKYSDISQNKYQGWVKAANYGKISKAISYMKQGQSYNSWLYNVEISGCKGQNIHNVYLAHPSTAMQLGYWN